MLDQARVVRVTDRRTRRARRPDGIGKYEAAMSTIADGEGEKGGTWGPRDVAEAWDRGAAARARAFGAATERMLELANIIRGSRVLDIAAGAGDQTLTVARRVGPTGYVLATDIAASMLDLTAAAASRGLTN